MKRNASQTAVGIGVAVALALLSAPVTAQVSEVTQCVPAVPCLAVGYPTYGTDGPDRIYDVDLDNDSIFARAGADEVHAGPASDRVRGEAGPDELYGEHGTDTMDGNEGADRLSGGPGHESEPGCRKDCLGGLSGGGGPDLLFGGGGSDGLGGGFGSDRLIGGVGADGLAGHEGADRLTGNQGADRLAGGPGNDFLNAARSDRTATADAKVNCGRGTDRAIVNPADPVARNCERVRVVR